MSTSTAHKRCRLGRLQVGFTRYIHTYPQGDKRYVLKPFIVLDYGKKTKPWP